MSKTWRALETRFEHNHQWRHLWGEIVDAYASAQRDRTSLLRRRRAAERIANNAEKLAERVETGIDLDLPLFEIFSEEVMGINGVQNWAGLDSIERSKRAHKLLGEWPLVSELLRALAERARREARRVMKGVPVERRKVKRDGSENASPVIFARLLARYFHRTLDQPLHAHVAAITNAVLNLHEPVDWEFVSNTYWHWKGKHVPPV